MSASDGHAPGRIAQALSFAFIAYALFSVADLAVKGAGPRLSPYETSVIIAAVGLFLVPFIREKGDRWRDIFRMQRPKLVIFRSLVGTAAGIFAIIAFTTIPIAEAYALLFLAPMIAVVLSIIFLREQVGWRRWLSVGIGMLGVLVVMRPGFRSVEVGHLAGLACGLCIGTSIVCLRVLGSSEKPVTIFGMLNFVNVITVVPVMLWFGVQAPTTTEWGLLILSGLTAGAGQLLLMAATRFAPANRIAPAQYSQLFWAIVLGAMFFTEIPDGFTFAGLLLIAASGLFLIQRRPKAVVAVPGPLP